MLHKLQPFPQLVGLTRYLLVVHPVDAGEESDILGHGHILVERELLRHVADVPLDLLVLCADVVTADAPRARRRLVQSRQHVHRRSLARAVGSQKAEYLALLYRKRYVVNSVEVAKGLHQVRDLDNVLRLDIVRCYLIDAWGIEDVFKAVEDDLWRIGAAYLPLVQKRHTLTTTHLVEIRRRGHNRNAALFQRGEHLPELLAAYWVDTCRRLIKKKHTWRVHQRTA